MARLAVLIALLGTSLAGCYESHRRPSDAAIQNDVGPRIPRCDPRATDGTDCLGETDILHFREVRATIEIDGELFDACFCAPGICRTRWIPPPCTWLSLEGDPTPLECADPDHPGAAGGDCVRPCDTSAECPTGMRCLLAEPILGYANDVERACFDVAPHVDP